MALWRLRVQGQKMGMNSRRVDMYESKGNLISSKVVNFMYIHVFSFYLEEYGLNFIFV